MNHLHCYHLLRVTVCDLEVHCQMVARHGRDEVKDQGLCTINGIVRRPLVQ